MDYMDHLRYDTFDTPVLFRLRCATSEGLMPVYDIGRLLRKRYGLVEQETLDVAQTVEDPIAEFAFDASVVEDIETVLDDVQTLIDNYNEMPDDLTTDQQEEFKKHRTDLDDITRPGGEVETPDA